MKNKLTRVSLEDIRKVFNPDSVDVVEFRINGEDKHLPTYFFLLSDYLRGLLQHSCESSVDSFEICFSNSDKQILSELEKEWKQLYTISTQDQLLGSVWRDIKDWYSSYETSIPPLYLDEVRQAFNIESNSARLKLLKKFGLKTS